jgi:hypothetical protein
VGGHVCEFEHIIGITFITELTFQYEVKHIGILAHEELPQRFPVFKSNGDIGIINGIIFHFHFIVLENGGSGDFSILALKGIPGIEAFDVLPVLTVQAQHQAKPFQQEFQEIIHKLCFDGIEQFFYGPFEGKLSEKI